MGHIPRRYVVGDDGARYKVTKHPHMVDAIKLLHSHTSNDADISLRQGVGPKPPAASRESKGLGTSTNPFDEIGENVHKVTAKE